MVSLATASVEATLAQRTSEQKHFGINVRGNRVGKNFAANTVTRRVVAVKKPEQTTGVASGARRNQIRRTVVRRPSKLAESGVAEWGNTAALGLIEIRGRQNELMAALETGVEGAGAADRLLRCRI